jgi:NADPH:quinone reductase-like Zn-dependent oxidoreductase
VAGVNGGADTFSVTRAAPDATGLKLGAEGYGVVVACGGGAEAAHFAAGERVLFLGGSYSEYVRLGAAMCFAPPVMPATTAATAAAAAAAAADAAADDDDDDDDCDRAAAGCDAAGCDAAELVALRISGLTAATALGRTASIGKGDVVLVTACCGATGSFAVQEAVARGATVVGTVGSDAKAAAARALGVSRVVNYKAEKLGAVLAAEFPEGVAVAYEGVGGALLKDAVTLTLTLSLTLALSLALTLALTLALALALTLTLAPSLAPSLALALTLTLALALALTRSTASPRTAPYCSWDPSRSTLTTPR